MRASLLFLCVALAPACSGQDAPSTCTDGVKGGAETDEDCGGGCGACAEGRACGGPADCQSGACEGGRCVAAVAPAIAAVTPDRGPTTGGAAITVSGDRFRAGATVTVGGVAAAVQSVSDKQLVFTLPPSPGKAGARDLVVTNPGGAAATRSGALRYYFGKIQLADKVDYATGAEPRGQLLADLNGDGALDVVTSHRSAGTFAVSLGKGDGTFQAAATYDNGGLGSTLAIADYDGDKKLDLATISVTAAGAVLVTGKGDGTFAPRMTTAVPDLLRLTGGDLDGDGKPDLILGLRNTNKGVRALLGKGDGTFTMTALTATPEQVITIAAGDLNNDKKLDVIASQTGALLVFLGNGDGTLRAAVTYPLGVAGTPQAFAVADLNGDGALDIASATIGGAGLSLLLNKADGTFAAAATVPTPGNSASGVAAADLDGDGRADLVISNTDAGSVTVLRGQGDGTFSAAAEKATAKRPLDVNLADLEGDGRLDVVVTSDTAGSFSVLRGAHE